MNYIVVETNRNEIVITEYTLLYYIVAETIPQRKMGKVHVSQKRKRTKVKMMDHWIFIEGRCKRMKWKTGN